MTATQDTICAVSTPAGYGGIAVIRVSGEQAVAICRTLFTPRDKQRQLLTQPAGSVCLGTITDGNATLDDAMATVFRAPHSFTGEDTVELSCHGSVYIQQRLLQLLIERGCRIAAPGEFTQRAFLNGKMDMSQAEAVADLIASTSAAAHRLAFSQMRGGFSDELKSLRAQLVDFVSLIELELDFSEEDVEFASREKLKELAIAIRQKISRLANSFELGNALKNGIPVALVGETNVGKSTLLNLLLNEEKAIVSDIHGTTRDVIEDVVNIQGVTFRFIDTAGIRKTADTVENMGIERSFQQIEKASIVLWLVDGTNVSEHIEWLTEKILKRAEGKKIILIFNKIDKLSDEELEILETLFTPFDCEKIRISAKKRLNTEMLQKALMKAAQIPQQISNDVIVSNARHYEALQHSLTAIERVIDGLNPDSAQPLLSGDLLSQDIRECLHYLGEITGEISTDEILGNIFAKFCIGK
ncbi:MAG: tRNA uridine-5-carboxymethylaminomethyl(34) synthesis GTPase MnmE [Tannerella sp.]|jgi:tRNA modification GTPase|nr:tRNA uridine-5-carboxymethylaminomethyl(34) synthesis GTPase MnmE [Tannerella sp.]